jgi:hypothetical protein
MAEDKSHSTKDLFLLAVGLAKLAEDGSKDPVPPERYYLKDGALRETRWNWDWFSSPEAEWKKIRYRYWLIGNLAANLTGSDQNFVAISEPMLVSMDLLDNEFKPGMPAATEEIKKIVQSKSGYERSFFTALSLGLSKPLSDGKEVVVFGAGMRRRTSVWRPGTGAEALRADVEFYVPFYPAPGEGPGPADVSAARSMCAGIAISRANLSSIGKDAEANLAAVRFNVRIPMTSGGKDKALETAFGKATIKVQKRVMGGARSEPGPWQDFDDWKTFVKAFCESEDGGELLNAPIGPILLATVSDPSGLADLLLRRKKRDEIKEQAKETKQELKDTVELLKGLWKDWNVKESEEPGKTPPSSSERKLGGLLESVGLLTEKKGKYSLGDLAGLTVSGFFNSMITELDGFPLYLKGVDAKDDKGSRIAITLASQSDPTDNKKHYFGLAGMAYDIPLETTSAKESTADDGSSKRNAIVLDDDEFIEDDSILIIDDDEEENGEGGEQEPDGDQEEAGKKSKVDLRLQLGKWFEHETLDDNWFRRLLPPPEDSDKLGLKRRTPLPGIRWLPLQREQSADGTKADFSFQWLRGDLLSLGFDIKGTTKDGLTFLKAKKGPLSYFGLGAVEVRIALLYFKERVAFGLGIKLRDLRLSFGPKEKDGEKEESSADETIAGLQDLLADHWVVVPDPEKPESAKPKTRLSAEKKDKFSISAGYLSPLSEGSKGTLDIQLYDAEDKRGKIVWIPIDRRGGSVYLKQIGIGLKGVENVELSKGLSDSAQLTVAVTGGLRWPVFELGFIGASLAFPLKRPGDVEFGLEGLDISLKLGSVVVSGSFLKSGGEYAGNVTIDLPKCSIGAMGFYGALQVFSRSKDDAIVKDLRQNRVNPKLLADLAENQITPATTGPIRRGFSDGSWELFASDGKQYVITADDGKLNVSSPDKTLFIYGMLNAASGGGIRFGPIQFTALALGFGLNRRIEVPTIENLAEFPLVKMVMGEGGYQKEAKAGDLQSQLSKPVKDPLKVLEEMKDALPAERGQYVICGGVRFTIANTVDCFGLIVVQFGNDFEIALLGLARFRQPRDLSAKALCYVEMQMLMSIKPSEGCFKLQALLTTNSWIINQDCKLTGGFAVFVWFAGEHKGDFVVSLGGYHPRFRRPDHYPIVPRIGLSWPVNDNLSVKGGGYLAVTPSCFMLGAILEATFHSGRISAWFTAYLDVVIAWDPFHFELDLGVSMRIEAAFITTIKVTISASLQMWGPPVGGLAKVNLTLVSFDVPFGAQRDEAKPKLVGSWVQFSRNFINPSEADVEAVERIVPAASPITRATLSAGRSNVNEAKPAEGVWKVRGDELELAATTAVPVTDLNVGRVKTNSPPEGIQQRAEAGQSMLVTKPVVIATDGLKTRKYGKPLGVHPMGKGLTSSLNVTVVRDELTQTRAIDLADWTMEEETGSLPAALWDAEKPKPSGPSEPSAKLIGGCITGVRRLKPPKGKLGQRAGLTDFEWRRLEAARVPKSKAEQEVPSGTRARDIQAVVAGKQAEQKRIADALSAAGFSLGWSPQTEVRFRELRDEPLSGAVA